MVKDLFILVCLLGATTAVVTILILAIELFHSVLEIGVTNVEREDDSSDSS